MFVNGSHSFLLRECEINIGKINRSEDKDKFFSIFEPNNWGLLDFTGSSGKVGGKCSIFLFFKRRCTKSQAK